MLHRAGWLIKPLARWFPDKELVPARRGKNRLIALTQELIAQHRAALMDGALPAGASLGCFCMEGSR